MENFLDALKEVEPSAIREVFVEVPDVTWSDIGGLEAIKEELIEAVQWPLKYNSVYEKFNITPPQGILLHGPSGTGKTLLVRALAHESGVNFIPVKGPALMSKYVGESERAIREVFKKAKQASPSILYFDEIESLVPIRGRDSGAGASFTERVISQFLAEMSGIEELKGVTVLATTNRIDLIDPALLSSGRFDVVLELPMPDAKARLEIFQIHLQKKPLAEDVHLEELVRSTEGHSGGDIHFICRKASALAIRDFLKIGEKGAPCIEKHHFEIALSLLKSNRSLQ
jgi:transitional endoplasmic reticulum ATPase